MTKEVYPAYFSFWDRNRSNAIAMLLMILTIYSLILFMEGLMLWMTGWSIFFDDMKFFLIFVISVPIFGSVLYVLLIYLMIGEMRKLKNETTITGKELIIDYQRIRQQPKIRNRIPISNIRSIKKDGWKYHHQRNKPHPWYHLDLNKSKGSFGGLYHFQSNPRNLLVIYLKDPYFISNLDLSNWGLVAFDSKYVKEIIINIQEEKQKQFISKIMKLKEKYTV